MAPELVEERPLDLPEGAAPEVQEGLGPLELLTSTGHVELPHVLRSVSAVHLDGLEHQRYGMTPDAPLPGDLERRTFLRHGWLAR